MTFNSAWTGNINASSSDRLLRVKYIVSLKLRLNGAILYKCIIIIIIAIQRPVRKLALLSIIVLISF